MELIEKYLYAVGKKLPMKQRQDIVDELRSLIMDNLDDKAPKGEPTQKDIEQVLIEMGSPAEVAKRYRTGPSWLIGPELMDIYLMIIKIVMGAVLLGYLVSIIVSLFTSQAGSGFGQILLYIGENLLKIIPGLFTAVGMVTVIFALIQFGFNKNVKINFTDGEKWTPDKLEPIPEKDEIVKPVESILGIVFCAFALILFNVYRAKLGIYYTPAGESGWVMVEVFNNIALNAYIPLWSVVWALSLGLNGWLLAIGKHNAATKISDMFISALNIGILFYIANGPKLFDFNGTGTSLEGMQVIFDFLTKNQSTIFYVLAVLSIIGLITNLVKFIIKKAKTI